MNSSDKISVPDVTLICLTNRDFEGHKRAIDISCQGMEFGAVKLIWDEKIRNINDWNRKVIQELWTYVDTSHALLIHADGYVINPHLWRHKWLEYDYIGAPWPLPTDNYSYRDSMGNIIRVGNSVSLRSKKIMKLGSAFPWQSYYGNTNEDGFLCCHNRNDLEEIFHCRFAPLEVAVEFSKEHEIPENQGIKTFAFHSL